jgi:hypothetical protein
MPCLLAIWHCCCCCCCQNNCTCMLTYSGVYRGVLDTACCCCCPLLPTCVEYSEAKCSLHSAAAAFSPAAHLSKSCRNMVCTANSCSCCPSAASAVLLPTCLEVPGACCALWLLCQPNAVAVRGTWHCSEDYSCALLSQLPAVARCIQAIAQLGCSRCRHCIDWACCSM